VELETIPKRYTAIKWEVSNKKEIVDFFQDHLDKFGFLGNILEVDALVGNHKAMPWDYVIKDGKNFRVVDKDLINNVDYRVV
jgi:hypothetical protein